MHYAGAQEPPRLAIVQGVLAIPLKRFERPLVGFLSRKQIQAILDAPDPDTWSGRRDRVMLTTLYNTGARVSELIYLCIDDVSLSQAQRFAFWVKGVRGGACLCGRASQERASDGYRAKNPLDVSSRFHSVICQFLGRVQHGSVMTLVARSAHLLKERFTLRQKRRPLWCCSLPTNSSIDWRSLRFGSRGGCVLIIEQLV